MSKIKHFPQTQQLSQPQPFYRSPSSNPVGLESTISSNQLNIPKISENSIMGVMYDPTQQGQSSKQKTNIQPIQPRNTFKQEFIDSKEANQSSINQTASHSEVPDSSIQWRSQDSSSQIYEKHQQNQLPLKGIYFSNISPVSQNPNLNAKSQFEQKKLNEDVLKPFTPNSANKKRYNRSQNNSPLSYNNDSSQKKSSGVAIQNLNIIKFQENDLYVQPINEQSTLIIKETDSSNSILNPLATKTSIFEQFQLLARIKNQDDASFNREMMNADSHLKRVKEYSSLQSASQLRQQNSKSENQGIPNHSAERRENIRTTKGQFLHNHYKPEDQNSLITQNSKPDYSSNNASSDHCQSSVHPLLKIDAKPVASSSKVGIKQIMNQKNSNQCLNCIKRPESKTIWAQAHVSGQKQKAISDSSSYLSAMKALQDRIKELESQVSESRENELQEELSLLATQNLQQVNEYAENVARADAQIQELATELAQSKQQFHKLQQERSSEFLEVEQQMAEKDDLIIQQASNLNCMSKLLIEEKEKTKEQTEQLESLQSALNSKEEENQILLSQLKTESDKLEQERTKGYEEKTLKLEEVHGLRFENEILKEKLRSAEQKCQQYEKDLEEYKSQFNAEKIDNLREQLRELKESFFLTKMEDQLRIINSSHHAQQQQQQQQFYSNQQLNKDTQPPVIPNQYSSQSEVQNQTSRTHSQNIRSSQQTVQLERIRNTNGIQDDADILNYDNDVYSYVNSRRNSKNSSSTQQVSIAQQKYDDTNNNVAGTRQLSGSPHRRIIHTNQLYSASSFKADSQKQYSQSKTELQSQSQLELSPGFGRYTSGSKGRDISFHTRDGLDSRNNQDKFNNKTHFSESKSQFNSMSSNSLRNHTRKYHEKSDTSHATKIISQAKSVNDSLKQSSRYDSSTPQQATIHNIKSIDLNKLPHQHQRNEISSEEGKYLPSSRSSSVPMVQTITSQNTVAQLPYNSHLYNSQFGSQEPNNQSLFQMERQYDPRHSLPTSINSQFANNQQDMNSIQVVHNQSQGQPRQSWILPTSTQGQQEEASMSKNQTTANGELIRDIFEAESSLKLLNQRYEVLLASSRSEEDSKKKSEIRKEVLSINDQIRVLNDKLYVLKKKEKFIMHQKQSQSKSPFRDGDTAITGSNGSFTQLAYVHSRI